MLSFSFRAQTQDGKSITDRITAKTETEAWSLLEQQGYQAIELLDTELSAVNMTDNDSVRRLAFTAKEEQALRRQSSSLSRIAWLFCHFQNVVLWLPLLIWLEYEVMNKSPHAEIMLPADLLVIYLVWFIWANVPGVLYHQVLEASAWARWHEAELWLLKLQGWQKCFRVPIAKHELIFRLATAEAGQGRMEEALRRVAALENELSVQPGFYQSRLASLFFAAKDYQAGAICQGAALKLNPSTANSIDLAVTLVRRIGDLSAPQALFNEIDESKIPELAKLFVNYGRGILALEQGQASKACLYFEEALSLARRYAGTPLIQSLLLDARAYYGLALVAIGDPVSAQSHFEAARPMLIAQGDTALLGRCEKASRP